MHCHANNILQKILLSGKLEVKAHIFMCAKLRFMAKWWRNWGQGL